MPSQSPFRSHCHITHRPSSSSSSSSLTCQFQEQSSPSRHKIQQIHATTQHPSPKSIIIYHETFRFYSHCTHYHTSNANINITYHTTLITTDSNNHFHTTTTQAFTNNHTYILNSQSIKHIIQYWAANAIPVTVPQHCHITHRP